MLRMKEGRADGNQVKVAFSTVALALLLLTALTLVTNPVNAEYGPRTSNLLIHVYNTDVAEFAAFESATGTAAIDIIDWPLPKDKIDLWQTPAYSNIIELVDYSSIDYARVDINNQRWPTGVAEPRLYDPASDSYKHYYDPINIWDVEAKEFRKAVAHLSDKDGWISRILKGYGFRQDTDVPVPALAGWTDYTELDKKGLLYRYDPIIAANILDAAGFTQGTTPNPDYDPATPGSAQFLRTDPRYGGDLQELVFYIRLDDVMRRDVGRELTAQLRHAGIRVNAIETGRTVCYGSVMGLYDFHLYTGGSDYMPFDSDVDFLYDLYHSSQYWGGTPTSYAGGLGWSTNYVGFADYAFDTWAEQVKLGASFDDVKQGVLKAQERAAMMVHSIPAYSRAAIKAFKHGWSGVAGEGGKGPDSLWAFLLGVNTFNTPQNPADDEIDWAFLSTLSDQNVVAAQWMWDRNLNRLVYDRLIGRNPYDLSKDYGFLAESWQFEPEGTPYPSATFTLRPGLTFHNGDPITPRDVKFSIEFNKACGPGVASGYSTVRDVQYVNTQTEEPALGPRDVKVYFGSLSYFAVHNAGYWPILNYNVWSLADATFGWNYVYGETDFNAFTNRMLVRNYNPWEVDLDGDGDTDYEEDGAGAYIYQSHAPAGPISAATAISLTAFTGYAVPTAAVTNYLDWSFHNIGDVTDDKIIDVGDALAIQKAMGTDTTWPWGTGWDEYNPDADINYGTWDMIGQAPDEVGDGLINNKDLNKWAANVGVSPAAGATGFFAGGGLPPDGFEDIINCYPTSGLTNGTVTNPANAYDKNNSTSADYDVSANPSRFPNITYFGVAGFTTTVPEPYYVMGIDIKINYSVTLNNAMYRILLNVGDSSYVLREGLYDDPDPTLLIWSDVPEPNNRIWNATDVRNMNITIETSKLAPSGTGVIKVYEVWFTFPLKARLYVDDLSGAGTGNIVEESLRPGASSTNSYPSNWAGNASVTDPTYAYDSNPQTYASINIGATVYPYPSWFGVTSFNASDPPPKPSYFFIDVKMNYSVTLSLARYRILAVVGSKNTTLQDWTSVQRTNPSLRTFPSVIEPNDGVWNWTDISNLAIRVEVKKSSTSGTGTFREYETWVTTLGDRFVVGISATNIKNLYSYEFKLNWTSPVLNVTKVIEGPFLRSSAQTSSAFSYPKIYNDAAGSYVYVFASLTYPTVRGVYGTGVLAYIEFQVELPYNVTDLHLYDTMTSDSFDPLIPHTTTDGYFKNWMKGDANGDEWVNSLDIGTLNAHWSPVGGKPEWSLGYSKDVDCNMDGYINSLDIGVVNAHWANHYS